MTPLCPCGTPVTDGVICWGCTQNLREALETIPALAEDLEVTITRQARMSDGTIRGAERPLPYNPVASEAAWVLRNALVGWVRVLAEEAA